MVAPAVIAAAIGAGATLLGGGAAVGSSFLNYKQQKKLQDHSAKLNYEYSLKSALNTPSSTRAGLEKAGYNPMLAVQNSTSGANSSWTGTGQASSSDLSTGVGTGLANALSYLRFENETAQTRSVVDSNAASADLSRAQASNLREENPFISERERSRIGNLNAQTAELDARVENMRSRLELDRMLGIMGLDVQRRGQDINADTERRAQDINAETQRGMRTDRLPFGIGTTYYDMRYKDPRMRVNDPNNRKYWREYYY